VKSGLAMLLRGTALAAADPAELCHGLAAELERLRIEHLAACRELLDAWNGENNRRVKWAIRARLRQLVNRNLITLLSAELVIPGYGFPTDVIPLDTDNDHVDLPADL
jgi:hypothetical protein